MIFRQLFERESSTYTYLLASGKGGEALWTLDAGLVPRRPGSWLGIGTRSAPDGAERFVLERIDW